MYVHQSIDQPLGVTVFGSHLLGVEDVNPDSIKDRGHGTDVDLTSHDEIGAASSGSITVSGAVMVCFALVDP